MSDFASTAMVRILAAGMRMSGATPPKLPRGGAHVTLAFKRELIACAMAQGGWALLPVLGRGICALRGDPVHQALSGCASPVQLMERWCRLERYIHSRHRVTYAAAPGGELAISHRSLRAAEPPLPHENLVVLGVLAAALEEMGATGVQVRIAGVPVYPYVDATILTELAQARQTATWHLRWAALEANPVRDATRAQSAGDDVLTGPPLAQALGRLLLADLMQASSLKDAARSLGKASRSLQRQLASEGLSYSAVVADTRCRAAAWQLAHQQHSVAETGLLCGFSDQAHFTRTFSRHVGIAPARYRREFSRSS